MFGTHKHECQECGTVWEHPDTLHGDEEAHCCPNCRVQQWWKYNGDRQPCYIDQGKGAGPVKVTARPVRRRTYA
jgi:predicted  nucleic acid-binding Zn-ribbon protein